MAKDIEINPNRLARIDKDDIDQDEASAVATELLAARTTIAELTQSQRSVNHISEIRPNPGNESAACTICGALLVCLSCGNHRTESEQQVIATRMRDRRGRGEDGSIFRGLLAVAMIYASAWATWYAVKWIVWAVILNSLKGTDGRH
jgi:hypothetical protein